jgi:hypothetical protein
MTDPLTFVREKVNEAKAKGYWSYGLIELDHLLDEASRLPPSGCEPWVQSWPDEPSSDDIVWRRNGLIYRVMRHCGGAGSGPARFFVGDKYGTLYGHDYPGMAGGWEKHNLNRSTAPASSEQPEVRGEGEVPNEDIVDRLRRFANGHPHAKIPWPHYVLHEGADEIIALRQKCEELERDLAAEKKRRDRQAQMQADKLEELLGEKHHRQSELAAAKPYKEAWGKLLQWLVDTANYPVIPVMDSLLTQPSPAAESKDAGGGT